MAMTVMSRPVRCASDGALRASAMPFKEGGTAAERFGTNPNMSHLSERLRPQCSGTFAISKWVYYPTCQAANEDHGHREQAPDSRRARAVLEFLWTFESIERCRFLDENGTLLCAFGLHQFRNCYSRESGGRLQEQKTFAGAV